MLKRHKSYIIIIGCVFLLLVLIAVFMARRSIQEPEPQVTSESFRSVTAAPTIAISGVVGVNLDALEVKTSTEKIRSLDPQLPFETVVSLETGEETTVYIHKSNQVAHQWLLTVNIDNVDYEIPDSSPDMPKQRELFRRGALAVHEWIRSQNVDPSTIMILWGDTKKVQDRSLEWLQ